MSRCSFSDCLGVEISGYGSLRCRDQVYVFIREPCENPASVNCIPTWRPDPRGSHDQCSNCVTTQREIFPRGVKSSPSKQKVHTPRHAAPNYAQPPYVHPPGYEDSRPSPPLEPVTSAGLEPPPTPSRLNLPVVPPMPTRRPRPIGTAGISATNTPTQPAKSILAGAGFPTPASETNSGRTGLRISNANPTAVSTETRLAATGFPIPPPEINSRRMGLRIPMLNTETRLAGPDPSWNTRLGRTGPRTPTAYNTVRSTAPIPSRNINSMATRLQTPAISYIPRPPNRRLSAPRNSTKLLASIAATIEAPTGQQRRLTYLPVPSLRPVIYTGGTETRTHPPRANSQQASRLPTQDLPARPGPIERIASRAGTI